MGLHSPRRSLLRLAALPILVCTLGTLLVAQPAHAALTITKTTWNVIGLDSNNVTVGPNIFPVAASVCNTGPSPATNLTTTFVWDSSNGLINLTGPAIVNRGTLAVGVCLEAYYWVAVTRTASAYDTTRRYHITATADAGLSASTPVRELYVERLVSQNRNTSLTPQGPTTVVVGQTYTYSWSGDTATQGYEQVTNFIPFDDRIFRVISVQSTYAAGRSPVPGVYNDACTWNDDPASSGYRSCAGNGKAGGPITMSITVQIIGTGSTSLVGAIYDFSGSSFHYNSDFGRNSLQVTAIPPPSAPSADLSVTKTDGVSTLTPGGTTVYTVVVTNNGPNAVTGATVTDTAPSGVTFGSWSCTGTGGAACPASGTGNLNATVTLPVGASVTFQINATVSPAASGSITNTAAVTVPAGIVDPNPGNNTATDTNTLTTVVARADLSVTKSNGVSTVAPGATTVYTVAVTNNGPDSVTGATVTDAAPAGVTFGSWTCTGAGGGVCPSSGSGSLVVTVTLPPGGQATFQITTTVANDASGSITNTATVTLPPGVSDPAPENNSASDTDVVLTQRIGVAKSAGTPRQVGASAFDIPYSIVVSNTGPITATNVQVTDSLDQTFATGSPSLSLAVAPTASGTGGATAAQCAVNGSFTGVGTATNLLAGNRNLEPGQGCIIAFTVRVTYATVAAIPTVAQLNTAIATTHATPGGERIARDLSDSGSDPSGTNPGAPGDTGGSDDPTPVLLVVVTPTSPSNPVLGSVSVVKTVSVAVADIGDVIAYAVRLRHHGGSPLPAMSVADRLPVGFAFVPGSAQLVLGTTTLRLPDPAGALTRVLLFSIPEQAGTDEATLLYNVRLSAGAQQGNGTNCVRAVAVDGTESNESCARVVVSSSAFTQQACIIGKVFVDTSGNRVQDPGEPGVPGVALYIEDGTSVLTDGGGDFSYCGLRAGTHVLKLDRYTLPPGAQLVPGSNRNALDAGSAFLDVKFGEVHRSDFVVAPLDAAALAALARRQVPAEPKVEMVPPIGDPPALAIGVVEGIVSFTSLRRPSAVAARPADVFDEELRRFSHTFNDGKGVAAGRAAMFLNGTVARHYRVSVSFDTERPDRGVLFRDIQPDAFYPIYGDASQKRFDAQTSRRYFGKVSRGKSYVLFGDLMTTAETPARNLGLYARTLTGVQHRLEVRNVVFNVFATRDSLRQVVDEFAGRGISGPYGVSNPNGVSGTEKVEIVTRDRDQPAVILSTRSLTRFLDYEFEPFSGRLLFRQPVPSMDEHLNPVSVRVTYEVDAGGERHWVDGFDGRVKVSQRLEIGGSWAQDKSPVAPYELASVNGTVTLGAHTTIVAEAARSTGTVNTNPFNRLFTPNLIDAGGEVEGNAARVEVNHDSARWQVRAFAGMSDPTFFNPAATLNGGRTEARARASYRLREKSRLHGELIRSKDGVTGGTRKGGLVAVESKFKKLTFEGGVRHMRESASPAQGSSAGQLEPFDLVTQTGFGFSPVVNEIDPVTGLPIVRYGTGARLSAGASAPPGEPVEATTIKGRISSSFNPSWSAYAEAEQDVTDADKNMAAVGAHYRATERARIYLRHEWLSSLDGLYALRADQRTQRTVLGVSSTYAGSNEVFSEYRMNDAMSGREAQAAIGLRNAWKVSDGLRLSTSLERLNPIRGTSAPTATAASFGAEFTGRADLKGTGRLDWRREGDNNSWLSTTGFARRVSNNWSLLAKNYYQWTETPTATNQLQDRFWVGTAYRDAERNRQNLLSRYEFKFERLPQTVLTGPTRDRRVHVVSTHGDYRRSQPWMLSGQYAGKWVDEQLDESDARYTAHLVAGRMGYDVTRRVDVGGLVSVMWSGSDDRVRKALGAEVGVLVHENTWLSVGYNVTGFSDRDFNDVLGIDSPTTRGFYIRLRLKFDERVFGQRLGSQR